jgi:triphosphoribosyl-dephospho-CoA synthase
MLSESDIAWAVTQACQQEVRSPKPGNVNLLSDGHDMVVADFLRSAEAIAPIMADRTLSVGEKILKSIQATRTVVDCNTNLGIVLLFAPLCHAMTACHSLNDLRMSLANVLRDLTLEDAKYCYEAIRLADAGGLSKKPEQDIESDPTITLLEAMRLAQNYDQIAQQYVTNFAFIFEVGLPALHEQLEYGQSIEWAGAFAYLKLLSEALDSLICRKNSIEVATTVKQKATQFVFYMNKNSKIDTYLTQLTVWDTELKQKRINPGTTADLVAATLLLHQFDVMFSANRISVP